MNSTNVPPGCSLLLDPLYFPLCDLQELWGVVVEAFASAGVVASFVLLVTALSCLPFVADQNCKGMISLQIGFLIFTLGLFGTSFIFIMGQNKIICVVRQFGFGVVFAGCFACLLMHGLWLVLLDRDRNPQGWLLGLGTLALWMVEVIINIEWIVITKMVKDEMILPGDCTVTKIDFTMALTYVMALLVAVVLMAVPSMTHKHKPFRRDGLYILLTGVLTICIWIAWAVMYIHGNQMLNRPNWGNPTLAIAMVSNGWVFLMTYSIPEICGVTKQLDVDDKNPENQSGSQVYENIYRDQTFTQQDLNRENKAFSKDNPRTGNVLVSPYSGYGQQQQQRSCVYQPTELAFITSSPREMCYDVMAFRATAPPLAPSGTFLPRVG